MEPRLNFYKASPDAIKAMRALEAHIEASGIEKPLAELVRLRASQINGCAYCIDMHTSDALKGGERQRRLTLLQVWRETSLFSPREQAALRWTETITRVGDTNVPDADWDAVRPHFGDQEIMDLTLLVVAINGWNRLAIAFRKLPE